MSLLENRSVGQQFLAEPTVGEKGVSGNTIADLREIAVSWDASASYCDECGEPELAARDRRFAAAMREAANILALNVQPSPLLSLF